MAEQEGSEEEVASRQRQRVFLGPSGGLVVAFRNQQGYLPVRVTNEAEGGTRRHRLHFTSREEQRTLHRCFLGDSEDSLERLLNDGDNAPTAVQAGVIGDMALCPGDKLFVQNGRLLLHPEEPPPLLPVDLLEERVSELEKIQGRYLGGVEVLDVAGQGHLIPQDDDNWLPNLLHCLWRHILPVRAFDASDCFLQDKGAKELAGYVRHWEFLRSLRLAQNSITQAGATALMEAMAGRCGQVCASVDLSYNAIDDVARCSALATRWVTVNVGPAWGQEEAERALQYERRWSLYMDGPASLFTEQADPRLAQWRCPVCETSMKTFTLKGKEKVELKSSMWMHLKGRNHMKCVKGIQESGPRENLILKIATRPSGSSRSFYYMNAFTGVQGWSPEALEWRNQPIKFDRDPLDESDDEDDQLPTLRAPRNNRRGSGGGVPARCSARSLHRLMQMAYDGTNRDCLVKENLRFRLPDTEVFVLNPIDEEPVEFCWREFLEQSSERYASSVTPYADAAYFEIFPAPAKDFNGVPPLYLVIEGSDGVSALLKPRQPPLFADAQSGMLLGRGDVRPKREPRPPQIFATSRQDVKDAFFQGSYDKVVHRARCRSGRDIDFSVDSFLEEHDLKVEDLLNDPRVQLDTDTHAFEVFDHVLEGQWWEWCAKRLKQPGDSRPVDAHPDDVLGLRSLGDQLQLLYAELDRIPKELQIYTSKFPEYHCETCGHNHHWWERGGGEYRDWQCQLCPSIAKACESAMNLCADPQVSRSGDKAMQRLFEALQELARCRGMDQCKKAFLAFEVYLKPRYEMVEVRNIRATHENISPVFRNGPHRGEPLENLVRGLRSGRVDTGERGSFPLEGTYLNGIFRSICNRRTYCLWQAFGKDSRHLVRVKVFPLAKGHRTELNQDFLFKFLRSLTSKNEGATLQVRRRPRDVDPRGPPRRREASSPAPPKKRLPAEDDRGHSAGTLHQEFPRPSSSMEGHHSDYWTVEPSKAPSQASYNTVEDIVCRVMDEAASASYVEDPRWVRGEQDGRRVWRKGSRESFFEDDAMPWIRYVDPANGCHWWSNAETQEYFFEEHSVLRGATTTGTPSLEAS